MTKEGIRRCITSEPSRGDESSSTDSRTLFGPLLLGEDQHKKKHVVLTSRIPHALSPSYSWGVPYHDGGGRYIDQITFYDQDAAVQ
jgi:hypothetical protein